jgi:predicted RNA polymerase sigma factor
LRRLGCAAEARSAYRRAAELTTHEAELAFLVDRAVDRGDVDESGASD